MKVILCSVLVIALGVLLLGEVVYADCPSCDGDVTPLHGKASAGQPATIDGRPAISVSINSSWDTSPGSGQTNTNIWNAVTNGLSRWNNATDVSGVKSNYYFDLRQTDSNAQITIVRDTSVTACAQSIMKGNPGKMVNGHWDPCGGTSRSLTANDVQTANLTTSTPTGAPAGTCAYTWQYGPYELPGPPPNDYVEPIYYYNQTCYYYYTAKDYYTCVTNRRRP